jgi:uncharacterized membrane protein (DUF106 family)
LEPALVILVITIILAGLTKVLQRKVIDRKKMKECQDQMKSDHKRFNELIKGAEKNTKELEALQTQILKQQTEIMNMQMKLSMFTLPGFLLAFWGLGYLYSGQMLTSLIPLPTFNQFFLFNPLSWIPTGISASTGYYKMYFFYYIIASIIVNYAEKFYDKVKEGKK